MTQRTLTPQKLVFKNDFTPKQGPNELEIAVQNAHTKGFDEGFERGLSEGKQKTLEEMNASLLKQQNIYLEKLLTEVSELQSQKHDFEQKTTIKAIEIAQILAKKTVDALLNTQTEQSIIDFFKMVIPSLRGDETLIIDVHEKVREAVSTPIITSLRDAGKANEITFISSPELAHVTDITIKWQNGGYVRSRAEIEHLIDNKITAWIASQNLEAEHIENTTLPTTLQIEATLPKDQNHDNG